MTTQLRILTQQCESLPPPTAATWDDRSVIHFKAVELILEMLYTLSFALKDHQDNRRRFVDIDRFETLFVALKSSFLHTPAIELRICEALFHMAVRVGWPFFTDVPFFHEGLRNISPFLRLRIHSKDYSAAALAPYFASTMEIPVVLAAFRTYLETHVPEKGKLLLLFGLLQRYRSVKGTSILAGKERERMLAVAKTMVAGFPALNDLLTPLISALPSVDCLDSLRSAVEVQLADDTFSEFLEQYCESISPLSMKRDCAHSMRAIVIESPELIGVAVRLLSAYYGAWRQAQLAPKTVAGQKPDRQVRRGHSLLSLSPSLHVSDAVLFKIMISYMLEQLPLIAGALPSNLAILCNYGLVSVVVTSFSDALQDANVFIQPQLLNVISQLARHRMSNVELRQILELLRGPEYPTNFLSTLVGIAEHQHNESALPRHYIGTHCRYW